MTSRTAGIRRQPDLPKHEEIAPERAKPVAGVRLLGGKARRRCTARAVPCAGKLCGLARQAAMDPGDGMELSE